MLDSPLNDAIRKFEVVEANLAKIEKVLSEIIEAIPYDVEFGENPEYDDNCLCFYDLLESLPKIDEWKPKIKLFDFNEIVQLRMDAKESGEFDCIIFVEQEIARPGKLINEYRHRLNKMRRELIREAINILLEEIDEKLIVLSQLLQSNRKENEKIDDPTFEDFRNSVDQINTLLGSSISRPKRWDALYRHMNFKMIADLRDIINLDWPNVKEGLYQSLYTIKEPIPVEIDDLGDLVRKKPSGSVASKLKWEQLTSDDFERIIFQLISNADGYENPQLLMKTNAPDRGRDLSVFRIVTDSLSETIRQRVIIQCKHWLNKSVGLKEISILRDQMKLWEPPKVDIHIIATSGRFTSDAVEFIEKHNQSDSSLRINMWPESHLERLLASRPEIIGEFSLR